MKKAFTLVELLIVIGIIGILSAVLLVATSGVSDRAKSVKCAANLKSLATSANSVQTSSGYYPFAQSVAYEGTDYSGGAAAVGYYVHRGWVSWLDAGAKYPAGSEPNFSQPSYAGTPLEVTHALTNGTLWRAVGGRRDVYLCPVHVKACQKKGVSSPGWSYQLNGFFGCSKMSATSSGVESGSLSSAERRVLFAEIPALDPSISTTKKAMKKAGVTALPTVNLSGGAGDETMDGCLRYKSLGGNESIGFNHVEGKRIVGHVAFADGHVESLAAPKDGNYDDLTDWLCRGLDVSYYNGQYTKAASNQ